jgi:hypothetical protein
MQELDGEMVGLNLRTSTYFSLNATGRLLFEVLVQGATAGTLSRSLIESTGVDEATAATDVEVFLDQLHAQGLVEPD